MRFLILLIAILAISCGGFTRKRVTDCQGSDCLDQTGTGGKTKVHIVVTISEP